jgi:hypothetical protein
VPHMLHHACGYKLTNNGNDMRAAQYYLGRANALYCSLYRDGGGPLRALLEVLALAPQTEAVANFSWKPNSARVTARARARDQMTMGRFYQRVGNAIAEYPIARHANFSKAQKVLQHPTTRIEFRPQSDCRRRSVRRRTAAGCAGGSVIDGVGNPPRKADVVIRGQRICIQPPADFAACSIAFVVTGSA